MSALVYAKINKKTLRFIRVEKQVSYEYVERITKISENQISLWEDENSDKLPTINQAKMLARCYRVPFAGLYMNSEDININYLPKLINKRSMVGVISDDSEVNLALLDLINEREFFIETKEKLQDSIPFFDFRILDDRNKFEWARKIREYFEITLSDQYKCRSKRKFYLYLREKIESKGIFIQGFQKVDVATLRGVAIVDGSIPIIGINDNDRYPAKSFSILHELVHIINRTSSICNDMLDSRPWDDEEVFCNAVAGEVLVPEADLKYMVEDYTHFSIDEVDYLAGKFSVSSEVIARRLYDTNICQRLWYEQIIDELRQRFLKEKENMKKARELGLSNGPRRNMPREAIDRTSILLCDALIRGYSKGIIDKTDISVHIGIGQKHINKFIAEVMGWY